MKTTSAGLPAPTRYVPSGDGKVPLISLIAILSISMCINLPGLAVSPMLGKLQHIFHSSELEAQLLTSLPNLVMVPVVLIAGRIATPKWQTAVLTTGLAVFFLSGVLSLFADSMGYLIFLGCLGGVGCGLVVPIAAGAISEWFVRKPRQRDLGLKSTTSNTMVIIANLFVGWIVVRNWHMAFAVYLIPTIPLCLVPFMTQRYLRKNRIVNEKVVDVPDDKSALDGAAYHFQGRYSTRLLIALIVLYMLQTYCTTCISYYAPFMMKAYGMDTSQVGIVTAAYYLMVAVSGAFVGTLKRFFGRPVMFICIAVMAAGLIIMGFSKSYLVLILSSLCVGFVYGIFQPIIYNKTTYIAPSQKAGTKYFGYVLSSNYVAIMMVPFVDNFFRKIFHSTEPGFEFVLSGVVTAIILVWALFERKNYVFAVDPLTAAPSPREVEAAEAAQRILDQKRAAAGSASVPASTPAPESVSPAAPTPSGHAPGPVDLADADGAARAASAAMQEADRAASQLSEAEKAAAAAADKMAAAEDAAAKAAHAAAEAARRAAAEARGNETNPGQ